MMDGRLNAASLRKATISQRTSPRLAARDRNDHVRIIDRVELLPCQETK